MKKLVLKGIIYGVLIFISLEVYIRVLHLTKDYPSRYVDEHSVEKWRANQTGFSVTGNRRQNFSEYHINNSGFNSYREFTPTKDKLELALVGDSFIQGFHQDYYNSIGKKIEDKIPEIEVYEYGYAGYDFADQLHLMHKYKKDFDVIDEVIIGLKFEDDLTRAKYAVIQDRLKLESPLFKNLRKIKLLSYTQNIGILDPLKKLPGRVLSVFKSKPKKKKELNILEQKEKEHQVNQQYFKNFVSLVNTYGYDKERFVLLLEETITPKFFLEYLKQNNFKYIDFSKTLNQSKIPTTLIYDQHWNNHGRNLIAKLITKNTRLKK